MQINHIGKNDEQNEESPLRQGIAAVAFVAGLAVGWYFFFPVLRVVFLSLI